MPASAPSRGRALVALLLIAPAPSVGVIAALTLKHAALGTILWGAAKVWLLGLPLLWRVLVERQPLSLSPPRHGGFTLAAVSGIVIGLAILSGYMLVGRDQIDAALLQRTLEPVGLTHRATYIGAALYWIFVNSVLEEYVYRWFVFRQAEQLTPGRPAAVPVVVSGVIFTVHHTIAMAAYFNAWITALASLGVFIGGAWWSLLYMRYRSVWVPWVSHAIVDAAIFAIGWALLFGAR